MSESQRLIGFKASANVEFLRLKKSSLTRQHAVLNTLIHSMKEELEKIQASLEANDELYFAVVYDE